MNATHCLRVIMKEEAVLGVTGCEDVSGAVSAGRTFNGRVEMKCCFVTPTATDDTLHRAGRLVFDDGRIVHHLGPLQRTASVVSAVLCEVPPQTVRLEVYVVPSPALHPSERLLAEHCHAILEQDEFGGSVAASHLQNQVRELPFFSAVVGPIHPQWANFVRSHPDLWSVFKYTAEDLEATGIKHTCRTTDLRVVARSLEDSFKEGDAARETVRSNAEHNLQELLVTKLSQRPYEQSELLKDLINEKHFLAVITPNLSKVLAMFEAEPAKYFVLRDPLHPIRVEPVRHA